jgi:hypothetical protein
MTRVDVLGGHAVAVLRSHVRSLRSPARCAAVHTNPVIRATRSRQSLQLPTDVRPSACAGDSGVTERSSASGLHDSSCRLESRPWTASRRRERSEDKWTPLRATQTALQSRRRTQNSGICRVVVPAAARSGLVAHHSVSPCKRALSGQALSRRSCRRGQIWGTDASSTTPGTTVEAGADEPPARLLGDEAELHARYNRELITDVLGIPA